MDVILYFNRQDKTISNNILLKIKELYNGPKNQDNIST